MGTQTSGPSVHVLRSSEFPEHLSIASSNKLAGAVHEYFLTPHLDLPAQVAIRSWADPRTGVNEYDWPLRLLPAYSAADPRVQVHLRIDPTAVRIELLADGPIGPASAELGARLAEDLHAVVVAILEVAHRSTWYLACAPDAAPTGAPPPATSPEAIRRIFAGNTTNLAILAMVIALPAVLILGAAGILVVLAVQGITLLYADRIVLRSGSVVLDAAHPRCAVVTVTLPEKAIRRLGPRLRAVAPAVRRAVAAAIGAADAGGQDPRAAACSAIAAAGVPCAPEQITVVERDLRGLVQRAAERFGLPAPKIAISDSPVANAAATGVAPARASILVTAGSLVELDDRELTATIGHELGHVRGRDPLLLYAATAVLYVGGVFVWPIVFAVLGLFYLILALLIVYAFGKVLETRADTASAEVLGGPGDLADALAQIAYGEYYAERRSRGRRVMAWFAFDPHPPIDFRVARLRRMAAQPPRIRSPFLLAAHDCALGFAASFRGRRNDAAG